VAGSGVETTSLLSDETDTWSHDGSPATVTARAYRLVLDGSVVAGPQSAAEIAIPDGTGGQSYSYELQVSIAEGGGLQSAWTLLATGIVSDALELSQTADGEVEIDHATGTVTVTITSPSWYANYDAGNGPGVFTFDSALLASGPVNLVPPLIERTTDADSSGTTNEGDTVGIGDPASDTSYPGLWVYDPDVGGLGTASYQWQADAGGDGSFADLSGATSSTYTLTSGEAGDDVRVQETLADNGGSRTVSSAAVSVEAASSGFTAAYAGAAQSAFNPGNPTSITGVPIGTAEADRWVVLAIRTYLNSSTDAALTSVTVNGGSTTVLATLDGDANDQQVFVAIVMTDAKVPSGTTADMSIDWAVAPDSDKLVQVDAYSIVAANQPTTADSGADPNNAISLDVIAGDVAIGASQNVNGGDPSTSWTGLTHRNSADVGNEFGNDWASVADDLAIASTATLSVDASGPVVGVVLRETP
jgi:hypothetical protein